MPQVRARTSPGVFRDMALLGLCLELSFKEPTVADQRSAKVSSYIKSQCPFALKFSTPKSFDALSNVSSASISQDALE